MSEVGPFLASAPALWGAGFQAMPLRPKAKLPFINEWQKWAEETVSDEDKIGWLNNPENANWNVGVVCGPASDLCIVDIDTRDESLARTIEALLPPTPWRRVGAKGVALAYRYSSIPNFQIKEAGGGVLVELLSSRRQVVVPPSIHPDTGLPYTADSELHDARPTMLLLPPGLEGMLRAAIEACGYRLSVSGHTRVTDYVSRGARDVQMIGVAGHYARGVLRGELPFMQAVQQMVAWHATQVEKVAGDEIDISKGVQRIADFICKDVTGPRKMALPEGWDAGMTPADKTAFGFDVFDETNEKWSAARIRTWVRDQFGIHDVGSDGRRAALDYTLDRLAVSGLEPVDEHSILNFIVKAGGFGVTITVLKRALAQRRLAGIEGTDHTEIAKAALERLAEQGEVAFDQGHFWQWKGSHWEVMPTSAILKLIMDDFGALPTSRRFNDYANVLKAMETQATRPIRTDDRAGINFANGYLTLDMELLDHNPAFGCASTMPYRYIPSGSSGALRFKRFVEDCWGKDTDRDSKMQALREAIAVTLFGVATRFERAFCLHGPPKTGKSQMLKIISGLVPSDVTCAMPPDQWSEKFSLAEMAGKFLNLCGELASKAKIDGQVFKTVISGETVTAQFKNKPLFKMEPRCAHWFASNHIPLTNDSSSGFNRRWLMLIFENTVNDRAREIDIGTRIVAEEREEIVAWAVEAISDVMRRKEFTLPESHLERMAEIARANNSLRSFVLDSQKVFVQEIGVDRMSVTSEEVLYRSYFSYTVAAGNAKPVSLTTFRQGMRELGSELGFRTALKTEANGRQVCEYHGLTLATGGSVRLVSSS